MVILDIRRLHDITNDLAFPTWELKRSQFPSYWEKVKHFSMTSSSSSTITEKLPSTEELKEDVAKATKKSLQSLRDLVAGGVGGICAVVVGHPFDLVKVRLQTAEKGVYTGAMDVVRKTIAREGPIRVGICLHTLSRKSVVLIFIRGFVCRCIRTIGRRDTYV